MIYQNALQNQAWKPFSRVPNAKEIANGLKDIPKNWSLTPLQDKSPRRQNWQTEEFIPHSEIARSILHGEKKISKKGNPYTAYWSGFGLRTGDVSDGKLAIDVDGSSAQPILEAVSGSNLPRTVSWTSGKPGRYQLLFQIPNEFRPLLKDFNRAVLTEWEGLQTARDAEGKPTELLEFRYNRSQSCLPPSRHPQTGSYQWINSPADTEVAIAPSWLCELLIKFATQEQRKEQERKERAVNWAAIRQRQQGLKQNSTNLVDFLEFEVLPRLSPEQIYCWEGHNFRQYGKTIKGCPPWRQSSSGTSFHVWWNGQNWAWQDKATGEGGTAVQYRWKLRGGHGTPTGKDFVEIVEELAKDAGLSLPEMPKAKAQEQGEITKAEWEAKRTEQDLVSFADIFKAKIANLACNIFKGFGQKPERKPQTQPAAQQNPDKFYKVGDRKAVWEQAIREGKKYILDRSATGTGKSHTVGECRANDFEAEVLFYLANDHRNPTTETIERNFADIPTRHSGLAIDNSRQTPLGHPFRVTPNDENRDLERTSATCHKSHLFEALAAKNIKGIRETENPICQGCPMLGACRNGVGNGYGFKFLRRQALENSELRSHPDSLPSPVGFSYESSMLIWDEADSIFKATKVTTFDIKDVERFTGKLALSDPELLSALRPLLRAFHDVENSPPPSKKYGWNDQQIRELLPEVPDFQTFVDLLSEAELAVTPDLSFLAEETDAVNVADAGDSKKLINRHLRRDRMKEDAKELESIPCIWLPDALKACAGYGAIRFSRRQFRITLRDERHREIAAAAKSNIFLSATLRREDLALMLDVHPDEILVIECDRPQVPNLKITHVTGLGILGKDRKDGLTDRVDALKAELMKKHPDIAHLEWKACAEDDDGYHFRDGRGTNRFKDSSALSSFGVPFPNIGAIADEYQALNTAEYQALGGDKDGFQAYLDAKVQAEIIQECGRLRSHMRPEEELNYYLVADYDLTFMADAFPGATITTVDASTISEGAASRAQKTGKKLIDAVTALFNQGAEITQNAVKALTGISQAWISKFTKRFGSWKHFQEILLLLLDALYSKSNISLDDLTDDERFFAKEYFHLYITESEKNPEDIVSETITVAEACGSAGLARILQHTTVDVRVELLIAAVRSLPEFFTDCLKTEIETWKKNTQN